MQSVKLFMRQIGVPNPSMGVVSAEEAESDLEFNYLSNGYKLFATHDLGSVRDASQNEVGYKLMFVVVKDEETPAVKAKK